MARHKHIGKLYQELLSNDFDIRTELLVNQAIRSGLHADDFVVLPDGHFFREYRKEVLGVERLEDSRRYDWLQLRLSRSGIYDLLPEGLFHQSLPGAAPGTAAQMAALSKIEKKKENSVRRFFQPLDHQFFLHRMQLDTAEEQLLQELDGNLLNDYFFEFWQLPPGLPDKSAVMLVQLLPFAHRISGDINLMQTCLAILLHEEVIVSVRESGTCYASQPPLALGSALLGIDLVCGNSFEEDFPCLLYTIGPLKNSTAISYVPGGANKLLLEVFNNLFTPVEADITINIEPDPEKAVIELAGEQDTVLGYSTIL